MSQNVVVVGISGVTCAGKTTIANKLQKYFPGSIVISQDDYFLPVDDPRHVWIESLKHINFDIIASLDMARMHADIEEVLHSKGDTRLLIVEGFCIFNYAPMRHIFNLKYYLLLEEEECRERRLTRVYEPPDVPGYFEECAWPEHLKQLDEVAQTFNDMVYFSELTMDPHQIIQEEISEYLALVK